SRKLASSTKMVTPKNATSDTETERSSRRLSECTAEPLLVAARNGETVAATAHGLDGLQLILRIELAAQAHHEDLEHVAVALHVLFVHALAELGLREHLAGVQHELLDQAVFVVGQLDRRAVERHP